jgi:putrescine transport system substrate-binding protein
MGIQWRGIGGGVAVVTILGGLIVSRDLHGTETTVLHLANRPDFIAEDTVQKFEAETGVKVAYDTYPSDDALLAALRGGNKQGWDLIVAATVPVLGHALSEHLLQPVERDKLSNGANLDPEILQVLASYDPGNKMAVPYLWGTAGLGINTAKLKEAVPDAPLDSLAILFDPALASRAKACGVAIADTPEDVVPAVLAYLGLDPTLQDDRSLARVAEVLTKLKPVVQRLAVGDFVEALASGKLCVGFGPSTAVTEARTRADDQDDGPDITYVIPKEHSRRWIDVLAIPANARNPEAARRFIDYVLRPEIISDITDWTGAANPNTLAADFVDDDARSDETIFPSPESRARLFLEKPLSAEAEKARTRLWDKTKP